MDFRKTIKPKAREVLRELEERDAIDVKDGTPKEKRVRCITPTVGGLLHMLVLSGQPKRILELGTSAGYSTIWLASAAEHIGARVISVDSDPQKVAWARSSLEWACLHNIVELKLGDAEAVIRTDPGPFHLVFIDHAGALYVSAFDAVRSKVASGGVILADGWDSVERWTTEPSLARYREHVMNDPWFQSFLLPIEKGGMISVRLPWTST